MMADYKQMYLKLLNATENAMEMRIAAQRQCENIQSSKISRQNSIQTGSGGRWHHSGLSSSHIR